MLLVHLEFVLFVQVLRSLVWVSCELSEDIRISADILAHGLYGLHKELFLGQRKSKVYTCPRDISLYTVQQLLASR